MRKQSKFMGKRVELKKRTFVKIEAEDYPLL